MNQLHRWMVGTGSIALAALGFLLVSVAHGQEFPSRPLQMVMPFPPGGIVDIMGRGFAQSLGARLGQQVVVVNRPGAGLTIGMAAVGQAPADGHTMIYTPVTPAPAWSEADIRGSREAQKPIEKLLAEGEKHPIEKTGAKLRSMMPWIKKRDIKGQQASYS